MCSLLIRLINSSHLHTVKHKKSHVLCYYASTLLLEGVFVLRNSFYERIFCSLGLYPFTNLLCGFRNLRKEGKYAKPLSLTILRKIQIFNKQKTQGWQDVKNLTDIYSGCQSAGRGTYRLSSVLHLLLKLFQLHFKDVLIGHIPCHLALSTKKRKSYRVTFIFNL